MILIFKCFDIIKASIFSVSSLNFEKVLFCSVVNVNYPGSSLDHKQIRLLSHMLELALVEILNPLLLWSKIAIRSVSYNGRLDLVLLQIFLFYLIHARFHDDLVHLSLFKYLCDRHIVIRVNSVVKCSRLWWCSKIMQPSKWNHQSSIWWMRRINQSDW